MTLQFHARLTADGKQAKVEIRGTADELKKLSAGLDGVTADSRETADALSRIDAAALRAASRISGTGGAATDLKNSTTLAAGSVGNLTAQFNDIGVMLAAGQNPLQLAIQQGTQITQVLGPMGAGQAVKALGSAFMSLLSPINLITIGGIAAGAALVQWLTRSEEKADDFADAVEVASEKLRDLERQNAILLSGAGSEERFGLQQAIAAQEAAVATAEERLERARGNAQRGARQNLQAAREELAALREKLVALDEAAALNRDLEAAQERIREGVENTLAGLIQAGVQWQQQRTEAQALLATLQEENNLREIALTHGEQSAAYALARADAERAAFEETLATLNVSEALKDELRAAFENGLALASLDMGGGIRAAAADALVLAQNLAAAGQAYWRGVKARAKTGGDSQLSAYQDYYGSREAGAELKSFFDEVEASRPKVRVATRGGGGGGRSGGRAGAARAERDEVAELTQRYEDQLAVLRETDPVQKEMLENRERLVDASAEEREKIAGLITQINAEKEATDRSRQSKELLGRTLTDVFNSGVKGAGEFANAMDRAKQAIFDTMTQAMIMGDGPMGGAFGTGLVPALSGLFGGGSGGGGGGLLGWLFGGQRRAEGGMIYGEGHSRQDKVPVWMSPGEMAVNARATAKHRALLEAINAGAPLPRYRDGGMIGGAAGGTAFAPALNLVVNNNTGRPVEAFEEDDGQGGRSVRLELADTVGQAMTTAGGGAQRVLRQRFGLSTGRARR